MEHIPTLSVDLITNLSELYPIVLPKPGVSREEELYRAGQRSVIDFLLVLLEESNAYEREL